MVNTPYVYDRPKNEPFTTEHINAKPLAERPAQRPVIMTPDVDFLSTRVEAPVRVDAPVRVEAPVVSQPVPITQMNRAQTVPRYDYQIPVV